MVKGEVLWNKLLEGDIVQFFILENVEENVERYAEENYGNGVDDLVRDWRKAARKAEYAVIEYYLDPEEDVWERIRLVHGEKSYIVIQYCLGHIDMYMDLMEHFDILARMFEHGYADSHIPHIPEEYVEIIGSRRSVVV